MDRVEESLSSSVRMCLLIGHCIERSSSQAQKIALQSAVREKPVYSAHQILKK